MSAILARFAELCRDSPARPLLHVASSGRSVSAPDIADVYRGCADLLDGHGITRHQLIVAAPGNSVGTVSLVLACRALDAAVMLVDAGTPLAELLELGRQFRAAAIVPPLGAVIADQGPSVSLPEGLSVLLREESSPGSYPEKAVLKLTSGSTGVPNAVPVTDTQVITDSTQIVQAMGIRPDDTQIAAIPLSHAYGLSVLLMPMLLQGTAVVLRDSFVPHQLPSDANRFGARAFPGVPFMFDYFISHPPASGWPRGLDRLMSAGARLPPTTIERFHRLFGVKIHTFYGTTESGGITYDGSDDPGENDTVGRPLPGVTITLKPDADAPAEGTGRVHIRSGGVADGYVNGSGNAFVDGGFLAGDYGTIDACGRLKLLGRASSFVNVAGRKVEPDEVELVLRSMPGIDDVRVVGAPDAQRGQQVVACIVTSPDAPRMTSLDVRRFSASVLAPHKVPRVVIFVDAIPLTERGKTDRNALTSLVRTHLGEPG